MFLYMERGGVWLIVLRCCICDRNLIVSYLVVFTFWLLNKGFNSNCSRKWLIPAFPIAHYFRQKRLLNECKVSLPSHASVNVMCLSGRRGEFFSWDFCTVLYLEYRIWNVLFYTLCLMIIYAFMIKICVMCLSRG